MYNRNYEICQRSNGLREVTNPSELLLSQNEEDTSGVSVSATIEGVRPFLIEVQALVSTAAYGTPQRSSTGFDLRRLSMLLAVLEKRAGFKLSVKDVFLNIAGGIRVDDPAIDLAVICSILSSDLDLALPRDVCFAGEIGLSGEIRLLLLLAVIFINTASFSQNTDNQPYHLTHAMSEQEKALMKTYSRSFTETDPPTGEVRNIAEWEPSEGVIIAYDGSFGIPYSLIAEMSEDVIVTTIVANSSEETTVRNYFSSNGVNLSNCNFVYQNPDSWWSRDYSPWFVAVDNSEVAIVNFPYNRPRPNDNDVPILMSSFLDVDLYGMDVIHTGGNYMCDGYGAAVSTDLVWEEETQTHTQINTKMENYLGITDYHVVPDPQDEYIKHIDCWAKYLDVDKILITEVPATDYRYSDYEAAAAYFEEQNCSFGYPYQVFRVQAADYDDYDVNPYTNSLIQNNKVFVPQTGSSLDDEAIAVYEEAMPGYEIIGVYSKRN